MKSRDTKADRAAKRNNTRALTDRLRDYCEEHGYQMPEEFLLDVMNGECPVSDEPVETKDRVAAAKTLMPYLYARMQDVKVSGNLDIKVPELKLDAKEMASVLAEIGDKI